jgi:hypothetical protein
MLSYIAKPIFLMLLYANTQRYIRINLFSNILRSFNDKTCKAVYPYIRQSKIRIYLYH